MRMAMLALLMALSPVSFAVKCYYTLVKADCWVNYDVTVTVSDAITNQRILTAVVPKGKRWSRQTFECQPAQKFMYEATFSPIIWEKDANKTYHALRFWSLPEQVSAQTAAWNIPVCFPEAFAEVPLPPDAINACRCDFSVVPSLAATLSAQ